MIGKRYSTSTNPTARSFTVSTFPRRTGSPPRRQRFSFWIGRLVLCPKERDLNDGLTLIERTGLSEASIYRAATELEVRGLIVCTRRGNFARRVSRYGITWAPLDKADFDFPFVLGFTRPPHWWRRGPPDWHLDKLKDESRMHREAVETICGSHTDNQDGSTVITEITASH